MTTLLRDVKYGLRALRKTPAFTAGAVLTVALTVGATTAIFSVVYGVLLRQLPYRDVERVFWIWSDQPGRDRTPFNVPDFVYELKRCATRPKISVVSISSTSLKRVSSPERTLASRGSMNWSTVEISGVDAVFLIRRPASMNSPRMFSNGGVVPGSKETARKNSWVNRSSSALTA